jgi:hypothetical protein
VACSCLGDEDNVEGIIRAVPDSPRSGDLVLPLLKHLGGTRHTVDEPNSQAVDQGGTDVLFQGCDHTLEAIDKICTRGVGRGLGSEEVGTERHLSFARASSALPFFDGDDD